MLAAYTALQSAWPMARGIPGAFGGTLDAVWVWVPLSLLFVAPFVDWRSPRALINLDLAALSAFSISLAFFNHADISASVPLVYPPLVYLLVRLLWLAWAPRGAARPLRVNVPLHWLALGAVFLTAFRVAYDVGGSSVIDVGYANVVGAQKIARGEALYGSFPAPVARGDTYGPASYEAYLPFVALFGFTATWGSLPAAHAAAIFFDLLCLALLFLLGRQIRGPALGVVFAYAWAAYPFTAFALESGSNDALLAGLVLAALLSARSAAGRGALAALASLTKLAPLAIAPLLLTYRLRESRLRGLLAFGAAFILTALAVAEPAIAHNTLRTIYQRTIGYQSGRVTPFSPWGLYRGWHSWQSLAELFAIAVAVAVALVPRGRDLARLAAAGRGRPDRGRDQPRLLVLPLHPLVLRPGDPRAIRPRGAAARWRRPAAPPSS